MDDNTKALVIATLGGAVIASVITYLLLKFDSFGRVKFLGIKVSFFLADHRNDLGVQLMTLWRISTDIFNSSKIHRTIRDLCIYFKDNEKREIRLDVYNGFDAGESVEVLTLAGLEHKRISGDAYVREPYPIPFFAPKIKYYLEYKNERNRTKRVRIKDINTRTNQNTRTNKPKS